MKTEFVMADEMDDKGRIYFIQKNKRHWIPSPEVAESYGWDLTTAKRLPLEEIRKIQRSYNIAYNFRDAPLPSIHKEGVVFHRV